MTNKIIIIYIEGCSDERIPKQEKYLFENIESRRFWQQYFHKNKYYIFDFILFPKYDPSSEREKLNKRVRIADKRVTSMLHNQDHNHKIKEKDIGNIKIYITGDHDEKNEKILLKIESIAHILKAFFEKRFNNPEILLKRDKNFKIECIMSEIVKQKINKNILKYKIGHTYPNVYELINHFGVTEQDALKNLSSSEHPIFIQIRKNNKQ